MSLVPQPPSVASTVSAGDCVDPDSLLGAGMAWGRKDPFRGSLPDYAGLGE